MNKYFSLILTSIFIFTSCVSQNYCVKESDLCGIIVDEYNNPVSDFLVFCEGNSVGCKSAYTNQSGIFVIPDLKMGKYKISGKKNNFAKIEKRDFIFNGGQSFFCSQVLSVRALANKVDCCIKNEDYEKGLDILNQVEIEKGDSCYALVLLYKAFLYKKLGKTKDYEKKLKDFNKNK